MPDKARILPVPARIEHLAGLSLAAAFVVSRPDVFASFQDWMVAEAAKNAEDTHLKPPSADEVAAAAEGLRRAVDWADREVARFFRSMSL